ncbi:hypothetical protein FRC02_008986 [Tulasnella sp. 418]|nr:hypothetical protein FRC02_008986 [Tulasnella sp. 418]
MRSLSLEGLPPEIVERIAIWTVLLGNLGPPSSLIPLQLTCRYIYHSISFQNSSTLYATLFKITFDTQALKRRYPDRFTATCLAKEYRRRWICLRRMKAYAPEPNVNKNLNMIWGYADDMPGIYPLRDKLEDCWMAYLMFTESDGKNPRVLRWANIIEWVHSLICFDIHFTATRSQEDQSLPAHSVRRSLGLWLYWFILRYENLVNETRQALSRANRMLRPYTFASFEYTHFFAPWSIYHLPITTEIAHNAHPPMQATENAPWIANLTPQSNTIELSEYLGSPLKVCSPLIAHAASLLFFSRMQRFPLGQPDATEADIAIMNEALMRLGPRPYAPSHTRTNFPSFVDSKTYDDDVLRLLSCHDPTSVTQPPGPRYQFKPGSLAGEWEGRFVIYPLDTHEAIMAGEPPLPHIERAMLLQSSQAWTFREFHHPHTLRGQSRRDYISFHQKYATSTDYTYTPLSSRHPPSAFLPSHARPPITPGQAMKAHIPENTRLNHVPGGLMVQQSAQDVFYHEIFTADEANTATTHNAADEYGDDDDDDDGSPRIEPGTSEGLEIILKGEAITPSNEISFSHSLMEPGSTAEGTIRPWDGLITVLATPLTESSGVPNTRRIDQWLYKGRKGRI